jgi:hypothetical protein
MSTTINYTNELGKPITEQQLNNISFYRKNTFEDNILKKVETFDEGVLTHSLYYVENNENLNLLIDKFKNRKTTFYVNLAINGIYTQYEALTYFNNQLIEKALLLDKNNDLTICYKEINPLDNSIITWEKYFYKPNGDLFILFTYKSNGELYSMIDFSKEDGTGERLYNSSDVINFDWTGLEYYQNGNPIIPI